MAHIGTHPKPTQFSKPTFGNSHDIINTGEQYIASTASSSSHSADTALKLPKAFAEELLSTRPGMMPEELSEAVCISILRELKWSSSNKGKSAKSRVEGDEAALSENEVKLMARAKSLESELRLALNSAEDIRALKAKAASLMEAVRKEKEATLSAERRHGLSNKRTTMLIDHTEKLMKILKTEATNKIKALESAREEKKLVFKLTHDLHTKEKAVAACKRLIAELREGGKILEDQLRLMDDRFLELRGKLDAARLQQKVEVDKARREASNLRKKYALISGHKSLDSVRLPPELMGDSVTNFIMGPGDSMFASQTASPTQLQQQQQQQQRAMTAGGTRGGGGLTAGRGNSSNNNNSTPLQSPTTHGRKRPDTAPLKKTTHHLSSSKLPPAGLTLEEANQIEVDKLLVKIHAKQREKQEGRWTSDRLRDLVKDESGKTGCAIPDMSRSSSHSVVHFVDTTKLK